MTNKNKIALIVQGQVKKYPYFQHNISLQKSVHNFLLSYVIFDKFLLLLEDLTYKSSKRFFSYYQLSYRVDFSRPGFRNVLEECAIVIMKTVLAGAVREKELNGKMLDKKKSLSVFIYSLIYLQYVNIYVYEMNNCHSTIKKIN